MNQDANDQDKLAEEWAKALEEMEQPAEEQAQAASETAAPDIGDPQPESPAQDGGDAQEDLADEWAKALAAEEESQLKKEREQQSLAAKTQEAKFKDLTAEARAPKEKTKRDLDFILDIPLDVSAELGRTRLLINELLQLGQGSVVELNKLAGEPLEIYVNGKLVARGEAVVINEKFGVRLTDIISPIERVKQLA
ncbi:MAG TPA: flagellar motor switch protein FliN [Desulfonatronum sp.]|nr:flagellar motor switch protein FliN [Desulfonatronum sp.]